MLDNSLNPNRSQELLQADASTPRHASPEMRTPTSDTDQQLSTLSTLLRGLDEAPEGVGHEHAYQDRLTQARLGVAASLFTALRAKHPQSASHGLRVALGCSAWAMQLGMSEADADELEMAALLHDIGKIGVPDSVLLKASRLDGEEARLMGRNGQIGYEILKACAPTKSLLLLFRYASAWFNGSKPGYKLKGEEIPLGARMISIVDAFDSMTTDHVYRNAMSRERAMSELFDNADTQFDPRLVQEFCSFISTDRVRLEANVARRWLQHLDHRAANMIWRVNEVNDADFNHQDSDEGLSSFHHRMVETMHDGVIYIDNNLRILHWNRGAERITGIREDGVLDQLFDPAILRMRDEEGDFVTAERCPVAEAIASGMQTFRRLTVSGRKEKVQLNVYLTPVMTRSGSVRGVSMLLRDASSEASLEERVQTLRERATMDQLTGVANRAEFDQALSQLVSQHLADGSPCSLIICDIDFFKKINDNYGHQAGDDVLVEFASLLKRSVRGGDLVARYGGEEFCILCADCDNHYATRQAEAIRQQLSEVPISAIKNECISASFGVTELQGGDSAESMLRRADRALYQAKDAGRNRVVQLGSGLVEESKKQESSWFGRLLKGSPEVTFQRRLVTPAPLSVTAEKLKGFVADHEAEILAVEENRATLRINGQNAPLMRRLTDRSVPFVMDLAFEEKRIALECDNGQPTLKTLIEVTIQPGRKRDRRRRDSSERAKQLLVSLKSYFMAQELPGE